MDNAYAALTKDRRQDWDAGPLLVLAAAVLWGTSGTAQALGPAGATPLVIAIVRVGLGGAVLLICGAAMGEFARPRKYLHPVFLLLGLAQAMFNFSYFTGLQMAGVAIGTMIAVGSVPIFSGLFGILLNREPAGARWYGATGMAVVGVMLLFGGRGAAAVDPIGVLFTLLAGFSYSFFTFVSGRMVRRFTPDTLIGVSFVVAACMLVPFALSMPLDWMSTPAGGGLLVYMGFVSSALAYMLYGRGLRTVMVSQVGTLTLAEPLTGSILGVFLLREAVSPTIVGGMLLIFLAQIVIVAGTDKRHHG
ncbi:MAG: EamA family transporter [Spirochaetes bacterium]|jgi:DME family drug/metabolite transporter|nr:EamA family transporter [Spirochaetota bacterium]